MAGISKLKLMEIANRIPLFKALDPHEKEQVISIPNIVKVIKAHEKFIAYGEHNDSFYIVLSGSASVYQKDQKIASVEGGQFVGEVGFICAEARTANVIADTDLITFMIDKKRFNQLPLVLRDKVKDKLINGLVQRIEHMNEHVAELTEQVAVLQPHIDEEQGVVEVQTPVEQTTHLDDVPLSEVTASGQQQKVDNVQQQEKKAKGKTNPMLTRITSEQDETSQGSPWCKP